VYTAHLRLVAFLAFLGAVGGIVLRRKATIVIAGLGVVFAAAFRLMPQGTLWNARMLPFWYLMMYFAAAACVSESAIAVGVLLGREKRKPEPEYALAADLDADVEGSWAPFAFEPALAPPAPVDPWPGLVANRWPVIITPLVILLIVLTFVGQGVPDWQWIFARIPGHTLLGGKAQEQTPNIASSWANWNYSGYEEKSAYPEYQDIVTTMKSVGAQFGCGRAMWEYEPEEDRFGTPMALMLLPRWTQGCIGSQEGLFFESSSTVPYHFLIQSELSANPSRAMRDLPYRDFNIADGIAHLQLLGVKYYMAISPEAVAAAMALTTGPNHLLTLVANTGSHQVTYSSGASPGLQDRTWKIFEVSDSSPVVALKYQPVVMTGVPTTGKGWQSLAVDWFQDSTRWDVPLAASGPSNWARVKGAAANPPKTPVTSVAVSNISTTDDRISFDVSEPGTPILVKTSYFPNWQATGANGPWRVTANSMVVVPTSTHVSLHYGFTPVDNLGRLVTLGGLGAAIVLWWQERRRAVELADEDVAGGSGDGDGDDDLTPEPMPVSVGNDDW
jgi:hypothetical protein